MRTAALVAAKRAISGESGRSLAVTCEATIIPSFWARRLRRFVPLHLRSKKYVRSLRSESGILGFITVVDVKKQNLSTVHAAYHAASMHACRVMPNKQYNMHTHAVYVRNVKNACPARHDVPSTSRNNHP